MKKFYLLQVNTTITSHDFWKVFCRGWLRNYFRGRILLAGLGIMEYAPNKQAVPSSLKQVEILSARKCILRQIEKNWYLACLVIFAVVMGTNQIYFSPKKFTILYTKVNMGLLTDKTTHVQSIQGSATGAQENKNCKKLEKLNL